MIWIFPLLGWIFVNAFAYLPPVIGLVSRKLKGRKREAAKFIFVAWVIFILPLHIYVAVRHIFDPMHVDELVDQSILQKAELGATIVIEESRQQGCVRWCKELLIEKKVSAVVIGEHPIEDAELILYRLNKFDGEGRDVTIASSDKALVTAPKNRYVISETIDNLDPDAIYITDRYDQRVGQYSSEKSERPFRTKRFTTAIYLGKPTTGKLLMHSKYQDFSRHGFPLMFGFCGKVAFIPHCIERRRYNVPTVGPLSLLNAAVGAGLDGQVDR